MFLELPDIQTLSKVALDSVGMFFIALGEIVGFRTCLLCRGSILPWACRTSLILFANADHGSESP